jgi:hypothetical protein
MALTWQQELVLIYGEEPRWRGFRTEAEHREAWLCHCERLMGGMHARNGHRPAAWWRFDVPPGLDYPGYDRERPTLFTAGLLGEQEARYLLTWWREQFQRAWQPEFFFCEGPGKFFDGAVARRKHYVWADIPRELVRKWTAERRRRGRTIRKLEAAATSPPEPGSAA